MHYTVQTNKIDDKATMQFVSVLSHYYHPLVLNVSTGLTGQFEQVFGSAMQLARREPVKTGDSAEYLVGPV